MFDRVFALLNMPQMSWKILLLRWAATTPSKLPYFAVFVLSGLALLAMDIGVHGAVPHYYELRTFNGTNNNAENPEWGSVGSVQVGSWSVMVLTTTLVQVGVVVLCMKYITTLTSDFFACFQ